MKIFNTLTRRKEEFVPLTPGQVKNVCMRTYCLQSDPHWKCRPMIVLIQYAVILSTRARCTVCIQLH